MDDWIDIWHKEGIIEVDHRSCPCRLLMIPVPHTYILDKWQIYAQPQLIYSTPLDDIVDDLKGLEIGFVHLQNVVEGDVLYEGTPAPAYQTVEQGTGMPFGAPYGVIDGDRDTLPN